MLIACDAALDQTMVMIGLKAFPAALVGGLDSLLGALVGALVVAAAEVLLIYYVDPLLSDVVPFAVLLAMLVFRPLGAVRHARSSTAYEAAACERYFRTDYSQDFRLIDTRTQRASVAVLLLAALVLPSSRAASCSTWPTRCCSRPSEPSH